MNCANHPEVAAVAFCRSCGKPLCEACQRPAQGTVYCDEHAPAAAAQQAYSPYTAPYNPKTDAGVSPGLAFILGFIPGVGAIYNGQYAKGLVHVIILGLLISITSSGAAAGLEPLFGMLTGLWFFYMAFEAYHTAKQRQSGLAVDEFSSLVPLRRQAGGFPVAPVLLITIGAVFLLNNLEIVRLYHMLRFWPVFLIALGAYMLYVRIAGSRAPSVSEPTEAGHER